MRCVEFDGCNVTIAEGQEQYETLRGALAPENDPENPIGNIICKFVLNAQERKQIAETGEIWLSQQTFGNPYAPICITTSPQWFDPEKIIFDFIINMHRKIGDDGDIIVNAHELVSTLSTVLVNFLLKNIEYLTPKNLLSLAQDHKLLEEPNYTLENYAELKAEIKAYDDFIREQHGNS